MNFKSFYVIGVVAITVAILIFLILRLFDFDDNTVIIGGIIGALIGAVIGSKLKY
tara:strand:+ start:367 stop:531 length:165 start_codon:yes stop_codon:yes gene_type:complete